MKAKNRTRSQGRKLSDDQFLRQAAREIHRLDKSAEQHGRSFITDIVATGRWLDRVKSRLDHGRWLPWLKRNFMRGNSRKRRWSEDTAENRIAAYRLSRTPKFRRLRNLPLEVLYLLGRRTVSSETRAAIVKRVEAGELLTVDEIRRLTRESGIRVFLSSEDIVARRRYSYPQGRLLSPAKEPASSEASAEEPPSPEPSMPSPAEQRPRIYLYDQVELRREAKDLARDVLKLEDHKSESDPESMLELMAELPREEHVALEQATRTGIALLNTLNDVLKKIRLKPIQDEGDTGAA